MDNNIPRHIEDTDFFKENANLVDFFNNSCGISNRNTIIWDVLCHDAPR